MHQSKGLQAPCFKHRSGGREVWVSRAGYERSTGRICARHGRGVNAAQIPAAAHALAVAHG